MRPITSITLMCDAYDDQPVTARDKLEHEIRRLKVQMWSDPADQELRTEIQRLEAELRAALDGNGSAA